MCPTPVAVQVYFTSWDIADLYPSINVSDKLFSRRIKGGILGELLKYDYDSSVMYELDNSKAFDFRTWCGICFIFSCSL